MANSVWALPSASEVRSWGLLGESPPLLALADQAFWFPYPQFIFLGKNFLLSLNDVRSKGNVIPLPNMLLLWFHWRPMNVTGTALWEERKQITASAFPSSFNNIYRKGSLPIVITTLYLSCWQSITVLNRNEGASRLGFTIWNVNTLIRSLE